MEFEQGQQVCLKSDSSRQGVVMKGISAESENRYQVFMDGTQKTFYASQLAAIDSTGSTFRYLKCEELHSYLTALQIKYPGQSTLFSLNSARVDFIPYQFRPVLKFIQSDRPRILIADGVGVGKTIEAGLILRELQARREVQSVLIICPKPLVTERKWQIEMKRFDESFVHMDSGDLRYCIHEMDVEGIWPSRFDRVIIPYSLFDEAKLLGSNKKRKRQETGLLKLDPPPRFDLVIVDEAHHIRNEETLRHQAVRFICDQAEAVVFLTATPIQLGNEDLYVLLNTLRPDLVIDENSFENMTKPNPFINKSIDIIRAQEKNWAIRAKDELDNAAETSWGKSIIAPNPVFKSVFSQLSQDNISPEERVQLITEIESLHTFSGIINRTRRRDIGEFTVRKPETVEIEFTPSQKLLHDSILKFQESVLRNKYMEINIKFLMTTIRRQLASCLFGLKPLLKDILERHIDEVNWGEMDDEIINSESLLTDSRNTIVQQILDKAQDIEPHDPKLERLKQIIKDKQTLSNKKVMLFSSFRHTLFYLFKHLKSEGLRVGMIHGGIKDGERVNLRNMFELSSDEDNSLDILLFSEIGSEGLDYQFCDCIINYDIPWNPMKIEQRIGRIDRNGQKSESVSIYNMITPGTIDAEIYSRCLLRIGIFENSIGGNEEILGEISRDIRSIAENYDLTESERKEKLQQLSDNKIRDIQEQEKLEQKQLDLFGIQLPLEKMKQEVVQASNFWLSPDSLQRILTNYLKQVGEEDHEYILGEKSLKTLRLSQDLRNKLLKDYRSLNLQNNATNRTWEKWLKGVDQHLTITFDSECASEHPEATLIMPQHPLAKQASKSIDTNVHIYSRLCAIDTEIPKGDYKFAIYLWQFCGYREDIVLQPVTSDELLTKNLLKILEQSEDVQLDDNEVPNIESWNEIDAHHHKMWTEARDLHKTKVEELTNFQRESLNTSHKARLNLLTDMSKQVTDEKIIRMRQVQISSANADFERRSRLLNDALTRIDIIANPVAYGTIQIK